MSATYDGIVSSGSQASVADGDTISMSLTSTVPASTPTTSTVLSILLVSVGNRLTPGSPFGLATLNNEPPYRYAQCWANPPDALAGNTSVGLSSGDPGAADNPLAYQLGFFVILEDNPGPITVPMELGTAIDSGDAATVYWEIRQYSGLTVQRFPAHTAWPIVAPATDGSGLSYESNIPYSDNTASAYSGLVDTPSATNGSVGTFASLPSGVGLVPHFTLAVGESDNGHAAPFDTTVDSVTYHDAGFTDQTLWTDTVTNADGTWSVGFAYAHYLNPPSGDLELGADLPTPSPASETFSIFGPPVTLYYIYPTEGYAIALTAGAGPESCVTGSGFYCWQRL